MPMVVRAYPLQVSRDELVSFATALRDRHRADTDAIYKRHGVRHESWHVQEIAGATWVICCTDVGDAAATAASYSGSNQAFDTWFKEQVQKLTGVDPNQTPLGPASRQLFSWTDGAAGGPAVCEVAPAQ